MNLFFTELEILKNWKHRSIIDKENDRQGVENCFWSAWDTYVKNQNDFRLCVTSAIALGNDANSVGAVAGGLVAMNNGLQDVPRTWLNTLILSSEVMETIMTFTDNIVKKIN